MGEILRLLVDGFAIALQWQNILYMAAGVTLGTTFGCIPGLGPTNGIAILLPITFVIPPTSAIIFLAAIYYGGCYGGAIASICLNIPGTPMAAATALDGYPMAKKGQSAEALVAAAWGSFYGGSVAMILFTFFAPPLADFALRFGPPEYFSIMMLAFATFAGLAGRNIWKTLITTIMGLVFATIGLDDITGNPRLIYGMNELMNGISFLVAVVGLWGVAEIMATAELSLEFKIIQPKFSYLTVFKTIGSLLKFLRASWIGSIVGFFVGTLPAAGATPAAFICYGLSKSTAPADKQKLYGEGYIEGVVAPECANNAASTGAMLPLFTLGVPGSPTAAVLLGGLLVWGLQPGPLLFVEQKEFVWGLIASLYTGNIVAVLMNLFAIPIFVAILRVPFTILGPTIAVLCLISGYAMNNNFFDIWLVLIFAIMGFVFKKLDYPLAPLILALVLGPMTERALRQSLIITHGDPTIFFTRPISGTIMVMSILLFLLPFITVWFSRKKKDAGEASS
jgi:putative tricarboxylic transport membrane protein